MSTELGRGGEEARPLELARDRLGAQIWIDQGDSEERIRFLLATAHDIGLGWVRLFLIWPWIEPSPGEWRFELFDAAFDAARRFHLRVKATLTANSGPWHVGTPSVLHSHTGILDPGQREPMRRYVLQCVRRYARHPALGQWVLWNEPSGGRERTPETLRRWREWLRYRYAGDIEALNRRWRTGYRAFDEVPFPEEVAHPSHAGSSWNSYDPWLEDWRARAAWLQEEIAWVRDLVREIDPRTPTCVNPTAIFTNQAAEATDLAGLAQVVDVLGASYHPSWHFGFARREDYPGLIAAGVRYQASARPGAAVEVTEVQAGNTLISGRRPSEVRPAELARFYLAGLAAGATAVTAWCLNTRHQDWEAGDWALLNDQDGPSDRSRMLRTLHDRLQRALALLGSIRAAEPRAWVGVDLDSQALEWVESLLGAGELPGRGRHDSVRGAGLLTALLLELGVPATIASMEQLPVRPPPEGGLILLSHVVAFEPQRAGDLLSFVERGGILVIDATTGRKDSDARLHVPWPGGLATALGLRATGLRSHPEGHQLLLAGLPAGRWALARLQVELDHGVGWRAWEALRFAEDGAPCVWERHYGRGRVVVSAGPLGPSLVHYPDSTPSVRFLLRALAAGLRHPIHPKGDQPGVICLPMTGDRGQLTVLLAPELERRGGRPVYVALPEGVHQDLWTDAPVVPGSDGEVGLPMPDGIALIYSQEVMSN